MQDDRSRLAVELDAALARARGLDRAVDDVSGRLDRAGATVRDIVAALAADGTLRRSGVGVPWRR